MATNDGFFGVQDLATVSLSKLEIKNSKINLDKEVTERISRKVFQFVEEIIRTQIPDGELEDVWAAKHSCEMRHYEHTTGGSLISVTIDGQIAGEVSVTFAGPKVNIKKHSTCLHPRVFSQDLLTCPDCGMTTRDIAMRANNQTS